MCVKWFCFEMKWSEFTVKYLGMKVPCTLGWPYTEGTWLYCDYFIWCVSCTVVIWTGFVMCGCFGNMCTCVYCVLCCLYCVFVLFCLCIFIVICFVCTSVRNTATKWKLNCSSSSSNNSSLLQSKETGCGAQPASYSTGSRGLLSWMYSSQVVKLTSLRMCGVIPPLP